MKLNRLIPLISILLAIVLEPFGALLNLSLNASLGVAEAQSRSGQEISSILSDEQILAQSLTAGQRVAERNAEQARLLALRQSCLKNTTHKATLLVGSILLLLFSAELFLFGRRMATGNQKVEILVLLGGFGYLFVVGGIVTSWCYINASQDFATFCNVDGQYNIADWGLLFESPIFESGMGALVLLVLSIILSVIAVILVNLASLGRPEAQNSVTFKIFTVAPPMLSIASSSFTIFKAFI